MFGTLLPGDEGVFREFIVNIPTYLPELLAFPADMYIILSLGF